MSPKTARSRTGLGIALALAGLFWLGYGAAQAAVTDGFTAHFKVKRGFLPLGTTTFALRHADRPGCYTYTGRANPNVVAHMFVGDVTDRSRFCIQNNTPRPSHFSHHIDGNEEKSYTLAFDWAHHRVVYQSEAGEHKAMELPDGAQDPLSIYIAARLALAAAGDPDHMPNPQFALVDKDEVKTFALQIGDRRNLDLPAGRYETYRVERADADKRDLRFWLAPYADWLPVQVEKDDDGNTYRMVLTRVSHGHSRARAGRR